MKKRGFLVIIICLILVLSGCTPTGGGGENTPTPSALPQGAVVALDGDKIVLNDITLTLPENMSYGYEKTDYGNAYYVWRTDAEHITAKNHDIVFYIYEGEDFNSPDRTLTDPEARVSIYQTYMQYFRTAVDDGRINIDAGITSNDEWYTLCFTGNSGGESEVTTYGIYCYPKTYYGVYMLQKDTTDAHSRHFYGFIFSNDAIGSILTKNEYNSLFGQLKDSFAVDTFFTLPQNALSYDPMKDVSKGYSYEQLENLFKNTVNFYIIKSGGAEKATLTEPYDVVRVVDGDTIIVAIDGEEKYVRLIGVDTPESVHPDESENTVEGLDASVWLSELLTDKKVCLEYDVDTEDDYGRTLAYVYLEDGITMVNRLLLQDGIARVMTIQPNIRYANEFYALQVAAREAKKGFWETGAFE